ncbi:MAG: Bax inhibitor-1/YccA family protein [Pseudomonadales bacterium]|nr:Bax inhibitor-1/YccA family protein [Pseudomonadales bacterium]
MAEQNLRTAAIAARTADAVPGSLQGSQAGVEVSRVLRNTYMLLGMTLGFSALMAMLAMALGAPYLGPIVTLIGFFALLFAVHKTANSSLGLVMVFALTGFMGFTLGPILGFYLSLANGPALVASALGSTAAAFVGLSAYALVSRKDFSFLSGFLVVGFFVILGSILASLIFDLSAFHGTISAAVVLFASAMILWQTSAIIHGGETNYILATVGLYVSIYNLFLSLLQLFGMAGDD